jgi:hypothetical protein
MTPEHEIWLPASVERKHGHVLVNSVCDLYRERFSCYRFRPTSVEYLITQGLPVPYHFHNTNGSIRYVNGRNEVYETNIVNPATVRFTLEGRQWNFSWEPVLFRKLHKLEWLFE